MILKIKSTIKNIIDYTLTDEFKAIVMIMLFCFVIISLFWAGIMTVLTDDLTTRTQEVVKENEELKVKNEYLVSELARYEMISEEYYELFYSCQESAGENYE